MQSNEVYCVKCRDKCIPKSSFLERDVRGRARMRAKCIYCGTNCYKYVSEAQISKKSARPSGRR